MERQGARQATLRRGANPPSRHGGKQLQHLAGIRRFERDPRMVDGPGLVCDAGESTGGVRAYRNTLKERSFSALFPRQRTAGLGGVRARFGGVLAGGVVPRTGSVPVAAGQRWGVSGG
jgi:hypothetical protein